MRKTILTIVASCALILGGTVAAFQTDDISSSTLRISWEEFKKLHDQNDAVIVDVRTAQAFEQGHIPGSRSIPYDEVGKHVQELKALKKPIVLYCA